ncbi:GlxA family transcriptional regulator [Novosphingobium sp. AP12]|uniref:GlxA family transcriptional regulator n=1 Tax=Novosphingobium sp. AP12 TaxID=1144305 RepID=UPI0002720563|nr:GlxA family transcriptional regulator [Novosphingobium sp. AP12]EJL30874.1 transcriptional regulator containing an amidase domain and an AraC-type DNA-binding HTH domain [Novosphingobium sp. AP12]
MPISDNHVDFSMRRLGFVLIDGFALMSYASVVEPYRAANMLAGRPLYSWVHISVAGDPCQASNGATFLADQAVGERADCDTLFVFAGGDPTDFDDPATFAWLRETAARGIVIVGISAGPYLLARAGLLDGYQATIHWEHLPAFLAEFPTSAPQTGLYVIDRRRITCAGGMAGMDLAVELIEREQGHALAAQVSDWFIRSEQRGADRPQRLSLRDRYGVANDRVLRVLAQMEACVEDPLSRSNLAAIASVSVRQLERLFGSNLGATVSQIYMRIRLSQSEQMLRTTALPITEVALACGFKTSSHFSRSFKEQFGKAPSDLRARGWCVQGKAATAIFPTASVRALPPSTDAVPQ